MRRLPQALCTVLSGPAWPLWTYLAMGLALRVPAVLCADGYEFVDQQFQYVDPAWHLATGQAWHQTWEWIDGIRSWVYPGFLAGILRMLLWLGFDEPMATMRAVRGVHAAVSLLPLWLFWLAVVRWRPIAAPRLPLLLFAASGLLVTTGVQPSGPALAATLAVGAALACHGPGAFPAFAGLLLGFSFCCRFQDAVYGPALLGLLLWQRRFGAAAWFVAGCVPGILLQGFVDLAATGTFLRAPWAYVTANVVQGAADKWEPQPWWFYLAAGVVPVLALVPPWLGVAWRRLRAGAAVLPGALVAALLHLLLHSLVARKALRFEYGALALLLAVMAAGLPTHDLSARLARWHRGLLVAVHALLFLWASCWFGHAGSVRTALALRADPAFGGDVLVVAGDATSLGGAYYLRQQHLRIDSATRADLPGRLQRQPLADGAFVVAVREPLAELQFAGLGRLEPTASLTGQWDMRRGDRRFVYRWRTGQR